MQKSGESFRIVKVSIGLCEIQGQKLDSEKSTFLTQRPVIGERLTWPRRKGEQDVCPGKTGSGLAFP